MKNRKTEPTLYLADLPETKDAMQRIINEMLREMRKQHASKKPARKGRK